MPEKDFARRAVAFVRSVLPAEWAHWLMLAGATLLFISANLRWWSGPLPAEAASISWRIEMAWISRLFLIAGAAAYYLCLVPRKSHGYLAFVLALVPSGSALAIMLVFACKWMIRFSGNVSVVERTSRHLYQWLADLMSASLKDFSTGFWTAAVGFVFVAVVFMLYTMGRISLPMRLANSPDLPLGDSGQGDVQRDTMRFAWMLISLFALVALVVVLPFAPFERLMILLASNANAMGWFKRVSDSIGLFVLVLWAMGKAARSTLRDSYRWPPAIYLGIAILIPVALASIWPSGWYLCEINVWAVFGRDAYDRPELGEYFALPSLALLWHLVPAMVEEVAWRGFLQPRFVRRYGIGRGIFFVGLIWGAFHFSTDFHRNLGVVSIFTVLIGRLCLTVAQSYVLGWLTLRSGSILPAALAHGFYNIFLQVPAHTPVWIMRALWAACGWVLFRYFPVDEKKSNVTADSEPALEPAI